MVALLFLLSLFFALLAGAVPAYATAPALLFVAVLMMSSLAGIDWDDLTVAAPVAIAALAMPLTFSIANGIAFGFIAWTAIAAGRWRELSPAMWILGAVRGQAGLVRRLTLQGGWRHHPPGDGGWMKRQLRRSTLRLPTFPESS